MRKYWLSSQHPVSRFIDKWVYDPLFKFLEHVLSGWGCFYGIIYMLAAWVTHVVVCIQAGNWILLIIGALFFPIGIVHGTTVWFGVNWAGG